MRISIMAMLAVATMWAPPIGDASAQSETNYTSLMSKNAQSEFDVRDARKIDHAEARELLEAGAAFVDVRRTLQYKLGHIPGAIGLELTAAFTAESLAEHVGKDETVVFYCSDAKCYRSAQASAKAVTWGYSKVVYFAGGWSTWLANGHPVEN